MTPISYHEASELLGVSIHTIRQVAVYNTLTRLPRNGVEQKLIKEQVLLFKDKKLSLEALNTDELRIWLAYNAAVKPTAEQCLTLLSNVFSTLAPLLAELDKPEVKRGLEALIAMSRNGKC